MQKIFQKVLKDTMYYNDVPMLIYNINYPYFTTSCDQASADHINDYYDQNAKSSEEYCRTVLYPQALDLVRYIPNIQIFNSYTFDIYFKITYNYGCYISLYMDTYLYLGGVHETITRTSNTWSFRTGEELLLKDFYTMTSYSLDNLQQNIINQVTERLLISPDSYFDNYNILIKNLFDPKNFYLIPNGMVVYFQQYEIAPYTSGIPEFFIPWRLD